TWTEVPRTIGLRPVGGQTSRPDRASGSPRPEGRSHGEGAHSADSRLLEAWRKAVPGRRRAPGAERPAQSACPTMQDHAGSAVYVYGGACIQAAKPGTYGAASRLRKASR